MMHINPETGSKVPESKRKKASKMSKVLGLINKVAEFEWTE